MLALYCCIRSSIRANLGGAAKTCLVVWCRWTQEAVYGPRALPRAVHRRVGERIPKKTEQ